MTSSFKPKRPKLTCLIVNPGQQVERTSIELYRDRTQRPEERPFPPPPPPLPEEIQTSSSSSSYAEKIRVEVSAWKNARQQLLQAYFDGCLPRENETCMACKSAVNLSSEHMRCIDCATHAYFCSDMCATEVHKEGLLPFHKLDTWSVRIP